MGMIGLLPEGSYAECANGYRIHYLDEGQGEVVVFLHGSGPENVYAFEAIGVHKQTLRVEHPGYVPVQIGPISTGERRRFVRVEMKRDPAAPSPEACGKDRMPKECG